MINRKLQFLSGIVFTALSLGVYATQERQSQECNTGIANLLKLIGRPEFFDEPPELFLKNSATFLRIASNKTDNLSNMDSEQYMTISLKNESWLDSGVLRFVKDTTSAENKTFYFLKSSFTIKRSCSPKRNDFLSLATKNIKGKFAEARMLDPDKETRKWAIPDPEEYWERVIELTENDELLVIDVSRIYRPEGDN